MSGVPARCYIGDWTECSLTNYWLVELGIRYFYIIKFETTRINSLPENVYRESLEVQLDI